MKSFDAAALAKIAAEQGTPVYVYDQATIQERVGRLKAFDTIRFAQKACSNTHILRLLRGLGVAVDAVSAGELERALAAGYTVGGEPSPVVFTADILDRPTLDRVVQLGVPVNAGSPDMLEQLGERSPGHRVWLRVNPGFGHGHSRKTNTGGESSKHGIWHGNLEQAFEIIDRRKLHFVGFHMHIGSGADFEHLKSVCDAMVAQVRSSGRDLEAISAGGGLPIPYRLDGQHVDTESYFQLWDAARKEIESMLGHKVNLEIEPGRFLVAESGKLVSEVRATKMQGSNRFVLVDAGFNDLVRPSMYGSFHEISFAREGKVLEGAMVPTVVGGPLCESGDVFTQEEGGVVIPRDLPAAKVGDLAVFHDAGAYGAAMSSNYNSRGLLPEVLMDGGTARLIRRRQTIRDLLELEQV
ncbi:MAG TPA: diaminopimelate decarboxylase [Fibrobacteria bacterium]|nr:diaminopimelate decarboxylase [Fibrobacteria bacterium]HOX50906.1 diaminopimelate decarboxylase [Fibrobacteria bacterium]